MAGFKRVFHAKGRSPAKAKGGEVTISRYGGLELREGVVSLDPCRSPDAVNMVLDDGGLLPSKRPGYKLIHNFGRMGFKLYGLHNAVISGEEKLLAHAGSNLYIVSETEVELIFTGLNQAESRGFAAGGSYFILDGKTMWKLTGKTMYKALDNPYIPTTRRRARPDGGGGVEGDEPNLLTVSRINTFASDGETSVYKLDAYPIKGTVVATLMTGQVLTEGNGFSLYMHGGTVTFNIPPAAGEEGVSIQYEAAGRPTNMYEFIDKARIFGRYGGTVYLTGHPDFPSYEWGSPDIAHAYFPDNLSGTVGDSATPIAGYIQQQDAMCILKKPGNDCGIYIRKDENKPVLGGDIPNAVGAICQFKGKSMYRAKEGIMEIVDAGLSNTREARSLSDSIAPLLTGDNSDLKPVIHEDRLYLPLKNSLLVGQWVSYGSKSSLEWNIWRSFNIRYMGSLGARLCFTDGDVLFGFKLPGDAFPFTDSNKIIDAYWTSPLLDMGLPARKKTVRDVFLTMREDIQCDADVFLSSNEQHFRTLGNVDYPIFDWRRLDFDIFCFGAPLGPFIGQVGSELLPAALFTVRVQNKKDDGAMRIGPMVVSYEIDGGTR